MKKSTKIIAVGAMCAALAATSFAAGSLINISVDPSIKILVNGEEFKPKDANGNDAMVFTYNGTTYAPLRALAEAYGLEVGYDAERRMATVGEYSKSSDTTSNPSEKQINSLQTFEPIIYSGNGDSVVNIDVHNDIWVLYVKGNDDGHYFGVKGYDSNDSSTELFVNTTDPYEGITFDAAQETVQLEISASGDWYIEIRSVYSCDIITSSDTYYGSGDSVFLLNYDAKTAAINGNDEEHYFGVKSYGESHDLLINTTDKYSGVVKLKYNPVLFVVNAQGSWNIKFE